MTLDALKKAGVPRVRVWRDTIAINFVILAFIIFLMVKQINRLKREYCFPCSWLDLEEIVLLRDIRDRLPVR